MAVPQPQPPTGPLAGLSQTLLPSVLRTVVPIIYALLVRYGLIEWLGLPDELITYAVTALVTGVFYIILRVLERYWDKVGWLLGFAARPAVYVTGQVLAVSHTDSGNQTLTTITTPQTTPNPKTEAGRASTEVILLAVIAGALIIGVLFGWDLVDFN